MRVLNRGLAILLAVVLILGSGAAFAVSPNANSKAMMNPGRMKAMEKVGMKVLEKSDIVEKVEISIISMENGNIGLIDGRVVLEDDNYEDYKGNIKTKVELKNVTVNIDEEGYFSQPMPMWKIEPLSVRVFMGKLLVYSDVEDDIDDIEDDRDLERALSIADRYFSRLSRNLSDLEIEDVGLFNNARIAFDILDEQIGSDNDYDRLMDRYFNTLRDAELEIQGLLEDMINWVDKPKYKDDKYEGRLSIHGDLMDDIDEILVIVEFVDSDVDDLKVEIDEDGEFSFDADENIDKVRVEFDGVNIPSLRVEF